MKLQIDEGLTLRVGDYTFEWEGGDEITAKKLEQVRRKIRALEETVRGKVEEPRKIGF